MDVMEWAPDAVREFLADFDDWRASTREIYDFLAGRQWTAEAIERRSKWRVPSLVFNSFARNARSLGGAQARNRAWIHYTDVGTEDYQLSAIFNKMAKVTMCEEFEDEISDAFEPDLLCTGYGCVFLSMDFSARIPRASLSRVHPHDAIWDPAAKTRNLRDRRWCGQRRLYSRREMVENWGEKKTASCQRGGVNDMAARSFGPEREQDYVVTHFQWLDIEAIRRYRVINTMTESVVADLDHDPSPIGDSFRLEQHEERRPEYAQVTFCGDVVLDEPEELPFAFTYGFMTGRRDSNGKFCSPLRDAMDPQRFKNSVFSTAVHDVMVAGKGLLMERGAVVDMEEFLNNFASSDKVKIVEDGAISQGRIMRLDGPSVSPAHAYLLQYADASIERVLGLNPEIIGGGPAQQSNVLAETRTQAAIGSWQDIFSSERMLRRELGRLLLGFITRYYPDDSFIRIIGKKASAYLPAIRDVDVASADIKIDEEPRTASQRQEALSAMQAVAHQLGTSTPPGMISEILNLLPLQPESIQRIQESMRPQTDPLHDAKARLAMANAEKALAEARALVTPAPDDAGKLRLSSQNHQQDVAEIILKDQIDEKKARRDLDKSLFNSLIRS